MFVFDTYSSTIEKSVNKQEKFMLTRKMVILFTLFCSSSAFAVSLENKDGKSYDISVKSSSSTSKSSIGSNTVKGGICSSCTINVSGVGSISASGSDRIIIKGGKLIKK